MGPTVVAGLVGSLLLGLPALSADLSPGHTQQSDASRGRRPLPRRSRGPGSTPPPMAPRGWWAEIGMGSLTGHSPCVV